jgi:hypothetical protein
LADGILLERAGVQFGLDPSGPEHARIFSRAGWSKPDLSQFIYDHAVRSRAELASVGKDAIARQTRWRLPADHPGRHA